jgi:hypothetical protein
VMEICCVFFEVVSELLNVTVMTFGSKGFEDGNRKMKYK